MNKTVISVLSPCGGVGKSTLSKELSLLSSGTEINGTPIRTCLVDTASNSASLRSYLRVVPKYTLTDWVMRYRADLKADNSKDPHREYSWMDIERYLTYLPSHNLYFLPGPDDGKYHNTSADEIQEIVRNLRKYFEVIIIDTGNNISPVTKGAAMACDVGLLVVTDSISHVRNADRFRAALAYENIPLDKIHVVMNKYSRWWTMDRIYTRRDLEESLNMDVVAVIPNDDKVWLYNNGSIQLASSGRSPVAKPIRELAHRLIPEIDA